MKDFLLRLALTAIFFIILNGFSIGAPLPYLTKFATETNTGNSEQQLSDLFTGLADQCPVTELEYLQYKNEYGEEFSLPNGKLPYQVKIISRPLDLDCAIAQILSLQGPFDLNTAQLGLQGSKDLDQSAEVLQQQKLLNALTVNVMSPPSTLKLCEQHSECSSALSCLPFSAEDYFQSDRLALVDYLQQSEFSYPLTLFKKKDNEPQGEVAQSCLKHYECESFYCDLTSKTCKARKFCRLGRVNEKVKIASSASLKVCEDDMVTNNQLACMKPLNASSIPKLYEGLKAELTGAKCQSNSETIVKQIKELVMETTAFELMLKLAPVNKNISGESGTWDLNKRNLMQLLPGVIYQQVYQAPEVTQSNLVQLLNKNYQKQLDDFKTLAGAQYSSKIKVNFLDKEYTQDELAKNRVNAVHLMNLWSKWNALQENFYDQMGKDVYSKKSTEWLKTLQQIGAISSKTKSDNEYIGNFKYILPVQKTPTIELENLVHTAVVFYYKKRPNIQEDDYLDTKILSYYSEKLFQEVNDRKNTYRYYLIDPPMPPAPPYFNGLVTLKNTFPAGKNTAKIAGEVWNNFRYYFLMLKPDENTSTTWTKELYQLWNTAIKNHFTTLAAGKPENHFINVELNLYAGCFQPKIIEEGEKILEKLKANALKEKASAADNKYSISKLDHFYAFFCVKDLNQNGSIEPEERIAERMVSDLAKKVLTQSILYSYNTDEELLRKRHALNRDRLYNYLFVNGSEMAEHPEMNGIKSVKFADVALRHKLFERIYLANAALGLLYQDLKLQMGKQRTAQCVDQNAGKVGQSNISTGAPNSGQSTTLPTRRSPTSNSTSNGNNSSTTNGSKSTTNTAGNDQQTGNQNRNALLQGTSADGSNGNSGNNSGVTVPSAGGAQKVADGNAGANSQEASFAVGNPVNGQGAAGSAGNGAGQNQGYGGSMGQYFQSGNSEYGKPGSGSSGGNALSKDESDKIEMAAKLSGNAIVEESTPEIFSVITNRYIRSAYPVIIQAPRKPASLKDSSTGGFQRFAP